MPIAIALAIYLSGYFSPAAAQEWRKDCSNEKDPTLKIQYCTRAIQSGDLDNKYLAIVFTHCAAAYAYKKDCDRAFQDYNQAIRLDPNYASAYTGRKAGSCDPNDGPKLLLSPRKV